MEVFLFKCFSIIAIVHISYSYSIEKIDRKNIPPIGVEIDIYSSARTKEIFDVIREAENLEVSKNHDIYKWENEVADGQRSEDINKRRIFLIFIPSSNNNTEANDNATPLDSWSVVWYIASFGGLIAFFLIVSCSEWCCRKAVRNSQTYNRSASTSPSTPTVPDTPPPSYDQFAPPSYDSINLGLNEVGSEKRQYDIYVVPVHALSTILEVREAEDLPLDSPPSYYNASIKEFMPTCSPKS